MDPLRNRVLPIVGGAAIVAVVAYAVSERDKASEPGASVDLCTLLACTKKQSPTVAEHVQVFCSAQVEHAEARRDAMRPLRTPLEQAPLTDASVAAARDAHRTHSEARLAAGYAALARVHAELDSRQRGVLADALVERGALALLQCPESDPP